MVTPAQQPWSALVVQVKDGADTLVQILCGQGYEVAEQWHGPTVWRSLGQCQMELANLDLSQCGRQGLRLFAPAFAQLHCPLVVVCESAQDAHGDGVKSDYAPAENPPLSLGVNGRGFLLKKICSVDAPPDQADWQSNGELPASADRNSPWPGDGRDGHLLRELRFQASLHLASGIAHDVNNYLTVVTNCAALLRQETLSPQGRNCVDDLRQAGERAAALLSQMAALCRREVQQPRVLDLNQFILDLRRLVARLLGDEIELVLELDQKPCPVKVDPRQMDQVLLNLAVNARDAMPRQGTFRVTTSVLEIRGPSADEASFPFHDHLCDAPACLGAAQALHLRPGHYVRLTLTDSGCGMSRAVQARIFEPFFTTKHPSRGSGVGLATVERIVQQLGGSINVDSTPGQGATFVILLPLAGATPLASAS